MCEPTVGMIAKLLPGVPFLTLRGHELRQTRDLLKNGIDKLQQARTDLIDRFTALGTWFNRYLSTIADEIPAHDLSTLESIKVGIDELVAGSREIITSVGTNAATASDKFEKLNSRRVEVFSRLSTLIIAYLISVSINSPPQN